MQQQDVLISDPQVRNAWLGLVLSVLFFGVMYAPARKYRHTDGVIFQFLMSCGVLMCGFAMQIFSTIAIRDDPYFKATSRAMLNSSGTTSSLSPDEQESAGGTTASNLVDIYTGLPCEAEVLAPSPSAAAAATGGAPAATGGSGLLLGDEMKRETRSTTRSTLSLSTPSVAATTALLSSSPTTTSRSATRNFSLVTNLLEVLEDPTGGELLDLRKKMMKEGQGADTATTRDPNKKSHSMNTENSSGETTQLQVQPTSASVHQESAATRPPEGGREDAALAHTSNTNKNYNHARKNGERDEQGHDQDLRQGPGADENDTNREKWLDKKNEEENKNAEGASITTTSSRVDKENGDRGQEDDETEFTKTKMNSSKNYAAAPATKTNDDKYISCTSTSNSNSNTAASDGREFLLMNQQQQQQRQNTFHTTVVSSTRTTSSQEEDHRGGRSLAAAPPSDYTGDASGKAEKSYSNTNYNDQYRRGQWKSAGGTRATPASANNNIPEGQHDNLLLHNNEQTPSTEQKRSNQPSKPPSHCRERSLMWDGFLLIIPEGLLGGVFWGLSNLCVLVSVKFLGLGVGFTLYHAVNLSFAYCVGRFDLFGVPPESRKNWVQDLSQVVNVIAFILVMCVETNGGGSSSGTSSGRISKHGAVLAAQQAATSPGLSTTLENNEKQQLQITTQRSRGESKISGSSTSRSSAASAQTTGAHEGQEGRISTLAEDQLPTSEMVGQLSSNSGRGHSLLHLRPVDLEDEADIREGATQDDVEGNLHLPAGRTSTPQQGDVYQFEPNLLLHQDSAETSTAHQHLSRTMKKAIGFTVGLTAGVFCGLNQVPYSVWTGTSQGKATPVHLFTLSQTLGIWFSAAFAFAVYDVLLTTVRPNPVTGKVFNLIKPKQLTKVPPFYAAMIPGVLWTLGFYFGLSGVALFGLGIGYVLTAVGPVAVSGMIATLVFDEIAHWKQKVLFWTAVGLMALSQAALIGFSD
ncbi:unnamed protein product [Amoebophrya sp. A120]|nr:unnamed protein product [Amoebophrya sp. A120]|eukprot:GSA120T00023883001.1